VNIEQAGRTRTAPGQEEEDLMPELTIHADQIEACQFETEPFTVSELDAINRYHGQAEGIPDCFVDFDADGIREFGANYLDAHINYLHDWKQHIDELYDTLRRIGGDDLNTAAARFIWQETTSWTIAEGNLRDAALTALGARWMPPITGADAVTVTRGAWASEYAKSWS
jgi:hypothetical protein